MSDAVEHYASRLREILADSGLFSPDQLPVIYFTNGRDIAVLSGAHERLRDVSGFHSPAALAAPVPLGGLPGQVAGLPPLVPDGLLPHQVEAVRALEVSLGRGDRRALVALPAGSGRTAIAVSETDRLLRHSGVSRVLFLVDRVDVGEQLRAALTSHESPDGRRFADDFVVELASSAGVAPSANAVVMTVQRLDSLLARPAERGPVPVDFFDFIWALDPERLTEGPWQKALDYFDAPLVGLTNVPTHETYAYFDGNLVAQVDVSELLDRRAPGVDGDVLGAVFERANRFRPELGPEDALLRALRETDVALGWRELVVLSERLSRRGHLAPAQFVLDFVASYLEGRDVDWAVDPCVSTPALLAAVVEAGAARKAVGFAPNAFVLDLAQELRTDPRVAWTGEDLLRADSEASAALATPGLVVSAPPFGMKAGPQPVTLPDGRSLDVRDDAGHRLLLQSAAQLDTDGEAIFLVADGFFRPGPARVRSLLAEAGLHVHAVIAIRQGFARLNLPTSFVFIRREYTDTVFVGELSPSIDHDQLVSLLKRRRRGPVPALGRLVSWEEFRGFGELAAGEGLETLLAEAPGEPVSLTELLEAPIFRPRKGEDFEPAANAVYLPTFAASPVYASRGELTSKPWAYFRLILDPDRALAEYVSALLNNPLGRGLRESIAGGSVHPTISRAALEHFQLPLPDIAVQRDVVGLQARIRALRLELDGLERQLSLDAASTRVVGDALDALGQRDPLTTFREALPFPLASILWRYEADADMKDKADHLHRFFEASAIYFATILLSAFLRDDELYRQAKKSWFKKLRRNSFDRSNFGTWTLFGHKMSESARQLLDDDDERQRMMDAFAIGSDRFTTTVASQELWNLLDEAKDTRNKEKGHSGIAGPAQHEDTHARLARSLTKLGELLGPCLGDVALIRPGAGRHRRGVTYYDRAELLQGSHSIFRQVAIATTDSRGLEDMELYLLSAAQPPAPAALRLEPFVRLKHSPPSAQNACYFYAELQNGEVEFVSHHFEDRPRIVEADEDVVRLITSLQARDATEADDGE